MPGSRRSILALINARFRDWHVFANARTTGADHCAFRMVGWRTVTITEVMVGKSFAQFVAVQQWRPGQPALSPEQVGFARQVRDAGGVAGIAQRMGDCVSIEEIGEEA